MKGKIQIDEYKRILRHKRLRKKVTGTPERPRLCVHRSLKNFQAQIIDDSIGKVLFGASTLSKEMKPQLKSGGNVAAAAKLGEYVAAQGKAGGITKVAFDKGGYRYHGRVKAFADAARKGGLDF